jgi:cation transport regulator ChaB
MAEKRIQPKAAGSESTAKKSAAAGVEKKSLKHRSAKLAKKHAGR